MTVIEVGKVDEVNGARDQGRWERKFIVEVDEWPALRSRRVKSVNVRWREFVQGDVKILQSALKDVVAPNAIDGNEKCDKSHCLTQGKASAHIDNEF